MYLVLDELPTDRIMHMFNTKNIEQSPKRDSRNNYVSQIPSQHDR